MSPWVGICWSRRNPPSHHPFHCWARRTRRASQDPKMKEKRRPEEPLRTLIMEEWGPEEPLRTLVGIPWYMPSRYTTLVYASLPPFVGSLYQPGPAPALRSSLAGTSWCAGFTLLVRVLKVRGFLPGKRASLPIQNKPPSCRKQRYNGQQSRYRESPCTRKCKTSQPLLKWPPAPLKVPGRLLTVMSSVRYPGPWPPVSAFPS